MIKKSIIYIFSLFCTTVMCLSCAVAATCTTTANCPLNQYCLIGMDGGICSNCTKPDNADWDTSGTRNGDGETSCPWKCNTGYYLYDDLCYECPYGSKSTSDGTGCYWENVTFSDKNGQLPVTTTPDTLQLSESLLEKARAQQ